MIGYEASPEGGHEPEDAKSDEAKGESKVVHLGDYHIPGVGKVEVTGKASVQMFFSGAGGRLHVGYAGGKAAVAVSGAGVTLSDNNLSSLTPKNLRDLPLEAGPSTSAVWSLQPTTVTVGHQSVTVMPKTTRTISVSNDDGKPTINVTYGDQVTATVGSYGNVSTSVAITTSYSLDPDHWDKVTTKEAIKLLQKFRDITPTPGQVLDGIGKVLKDVLSPIPSLPIPELIELATIV